MKKIIIVLLLINMYLLFNIIKLKEEDYVDSSARINDNESEFSMKDSRYDFGVFLDVKYTKKNIDYISKYSEIIIDVRQADYKSIESIRDDNTKIYSYLSFGSLETFREYYDEFENLCIMDYEGFDDECFIDVRDSSWQDYLLNDELKRIYEYEIDGIFFDNFDVYHHFNESDFLDAIDNFLIRFKLLYPDLEVFVNGGYKYFNDCIDAKCKSLNTISKINIEEVYSRIKSYKKEEFVEQNEKDVKYVLEYMDLLIENNFDLYVIEYVNNNEIYTKYSDTYLSREIKLYMCDSINLTVDCTVFD